MCCESESRRVERGEWGFVAEPVRAARSARTRARVWSEPISAACARRPLVRATMASLLRQMQTKASVASEVVTKRACAYYKQILEENKHHVVTPPTVEKCQELSKQLFYTRLASLPRRSEAFWKELDYLKQRLKHRNDLKVEEIGIAALFAGECYAWYCVGEIVGRGGTLTGYKV